MISFQSGARLQIREFNDVSQIHDRSIATIKREWLTISGAIVARGRLAVR